MEMLERAGKSEFLRTEFRLKLDWVLEPKNFRKVIEGNYDNKPGSAPGSHTVIGDEPWQWRVKQHASGGFWPSEWGPPPGEPGCRVPKEFLQ
jgi:hypothetical protein